MNGYAGINWKQIQALTKRTPQSTWAWNKPATRSTVKFIPNPSTTPEKLVRVKLGRGKAKLFRAPKAAIKKVYVNLDTEKTGERNACTVTALAVAAKVPYTVARNALRNAGRRPNRGFESVPAIRAHKIKGFAFKSILRRPVRLREFLANHPIGRFYCVSANHAFAVVNGKVYEKVRGTTGNRIVKHSYTIKPDGRE